MGSMQRISVLGATGSIGESTLDVVARHPEHFKVFALTAHKNWQAMVVLCRRFVPDVVVMTDAQAAQSLRAELASSPLLRNIPVLDQVDDLCAVVTATEVDTVMAAIVGAAGLAPTYAAVKAGKRVLLANKEALVMSGEFFMRAAQQSGAQVLPVDSEHNAIFQALPEAVQQANGNADLANYGVQKIILTGSGGPFRDLPIADLKKQTPAAACAHPNWSMGQKISVDSATMLNKGLEYIEARWLFNCSQEQLEIVVHPQSVIHSMVQYTDGSVLAQLGQPDMRTPIAHTMAYPQRIASGVAPLNFSTLGALTFMAPDLQRYPCLKLAIDACWAGQSATTALNAANEIAVAHFLHEKIPFTAIAEICAGVVELTANAMVDDMDAILACDANARRVAQELIEKRW